MGAHARCVASDWRRNMKLKKILGWSSALCLCATIVQAQETNEVEQLKRQMQQLQESFAKQQAGQQKQIEALTKKLDALTTQQQTARSGGNQPPSAVTSGQIKE